MSETGTKTIFVVGVWRSGTSLLYTILNQHRNIALMYEAEPFGLLKISTDGDFPKDWPERLELYNRCFSRHRMDPRSMPREKRGIDCVQHLYQTWAAKKDARIIGQKCPAHHCRMPKIATLFPNADFIVIWRNPLDCCQSVVDAAAHSRFFRQKGILTRTLFGHEQMAKGVIKLRQTGHRVHELRYEDLIADPEQEIRRICEFLSIPFDPQMLDLESADYSMVPEGTHHAKVRSGTIQRGPARDAALPPAFLAKARRYCSLWRKQYAGSVFASSLPEFASPNPPGWLAASWDHAVYFFWRAKDCLKRRIMRHLPLSAWEYWREVRQGCQHTKKDLSPDTVKP